MEARLIERELYSMQCCEFHSKAKYAGIAFRNHIAGLQQASCSCSEMYNTLKVTKILLSAVMRIDQHFGNIISFRKKRSG